MTEHQAPSPRTTMKRYANRADYSPNGVRAILQAGVIAHVGVVTDDGPIVLPMAFGLRDDEILVHGSIANAMLRAGRGLDVCITVTIVDGLVLARTPLHNSMNYRSVVVRGTAQPITDPQLQQEALKIINDHIAPTWDTARAPSDTDYKQTLVLALSLTEASAKVRAGEPGDDPEDMAGPHWAGVIPLNHTWGTPEPASDLNDGIDTPQAVVDLGGTDAHGLQ